MFSRNIKIMFVFLFLRGTKFFLPFLALYFEQSLFTTTNVAIIMSTRSVATMLFEIPSGAVSDLFGRKNTLLLSNFIHFFMLAALYIGGSLSVFLVYAVLAGLSTSLVSGTDISLIHDDLEEQGKTNLFKKIIGNYYAVWPAGAITSSFIGAILAKTSLELTIVASVIPVILGFVILLFIKEPEVEKENHKNIFKHSYLAFKEILKNPQLIILILGGVIGFSFGFSLYELSPLYLDFTGLNPYQIGIVSGVSYLAVSLGSYFSDKISEFLGNKTSLVLSVVIAASLYWLATVLNPPIAIVCYVLAFGFFRIRKPIINHFINLEATSKNRATTVSIASFFERIGLSLSLLFLGHYADLYNINLSFRLSSICLLLAPLLYLFIKDKK
jgi:MFS family permease